MRLTPQNLSKATEASFHKFAHFRNARLKFLSQMVGRFYKQAAIPTDESRKAAPINLLYSAVGTLIPNLVYANPKARTTTNLLAYRDYADLLGLGLDYTIEKIKLRETIRKAILDAIFMAGFVKTGLAAGEEYLAIEDATVEIGRPFADRIDPDDIVLDPLAKDWREQKMIGNRYRVDVDVLADTGLYDADELMKLSDRDANLEAQAAKMSGDESSFLSDVARHVDLVDIYIPRDKIIATIPYMPGGGIADKFLRIAEYAGPDEGPYHMLGFTPVSDNILPVAPAGIWYDLHILGNRIARKLARQAERLKQIVAYEHSAGEDMQQIIDADDGETVKVDDVDKIKEVQFGGAAKESYEWMSWVKTHFSEQAGSIDTLGGQGDTAPTLGQAEMLQANSSVRLADMQNMVYQFTSDITKNIGFYLHTDPLIELPLAKRVNGSETQVYLTPEARVGDWYDFNIEVKPYSMARMDPNTSVRRKLEFATNVIPAAAQAMALMGPGFLVGPFLKRMAQEVGIDDADEFINDAAFQQWVLQKAMMDTGDPGKAQSTGMMPPGMPMPGQVQPNQPVPTATGPNGGVSPTQETNAARQETSGEIQGSTKSMAAQRF